MRTYYVYILASKSRRLYVGMTNDLVLRIAAHRNGEVQSTHRYRITRLVYVETTPDVRAAIAREKEIKAWRREKKLRLVTRANAAWDDLPLDWTSTRQSGRHRPASLVDGRAGPSVALRAPVGTTR